MGGRGYGEVNEIKGLYEIVILTSFGRWNQSIGFGSPMLFWNGSKPYGAERLRNNQS